MNPRVVELRGKDQTPLGWLIRCPGCGKAHRFDSRWSFNGDVYRPTFTPALKVQFSRDGVNVVCHSYISDGLIQFMLDSTHELTGLVVALPEIVR